MKKILLTLFLVLPLLFLFSCKNDSLFTMSLLSYPEDLVYSLGEDFRVNDLTLVLTYADGKKEQVPVTPDMVSFSSDVPGHGVAIISYTKDDFTSYAYVNYRVLDEIASAKTAAFTAIQQGDIYKNNQTDAGVQMLYNQAITKIADATTLKSIHDARDEFTTLAQKLLNDKSAVIERVNDVNLSNLSNLYLALAENERETILLEIKLAKSVEEANEYATLFENEIATFSVRMINTISAERKNDLYIKLNELYTFRVEDQKELFSTETYRALQSQFQSSCMGILLSETVNDALSYDTLFREKLEESKTMIDVIYDALLAVYKNNMILYTTTCKASIENLEKLLANLPEDLAPYALKYSVTPTARIAPLNYDADGCINLKDAATGVRSRYNTLTLAKNNSTQLISKIQAIGNVTLSEAGKVQDAIAAFKSWSDTYLLEEDNVTLILGINYETLQQKKKELAVLTGDVEGDSEIIVNKISKLPNTITLADANAIKEISELLSTFTDRYGTSATSYITNITTFNSLQIAFNALDGQAKQSANTIMAKVQLFSSTAYKNGLAGEDVIIEAEEAFSQWLSTFSSDEEIFELYMPNAKATIEETRANYASALERFNTEKDDAAKALKDLFDKYYNDNMNILDIYAEAGRQQKAIKYADWAQNQEIFTTLITNTENQMKAIS